MYIFSAANCLSFASTSIVVFYFHYVLVNCAQLTHYLGDIFFISEDHTQIVLDGGSFIERLVRYFCKGAANAAQIMSGGQRAQFYFEIAFSIQINHGNTLVVLFLGERIFQRRSAIANLVGTNVLWTMDMTKCHIVKDFKYRRVYIIASANGNLL